VKLPLKLIEINEISRPSLQALSYICEPVMWAYGFIMLAGPSTGRIMSLH
jgi:hypothetical protein